MASRRVTVFDGSGSPGRQIDKSPASDAPRYTTGMLLRVGDDTLAAWVWEGGPGMKYPERPSKL